jgi:hypothetical protein
VSSNNSCLFEIPEKLINKELDIKDNYYIINNYNCLYGFSKDQYKINEQELKDIDLKSLIFQKSALKYYLLIDARETGDEDLYELLNTINLLNNKPKRLSIIIDPSRSENFYQLLRNNISCEKWTIHVFINSIPFNDCINIILDTNLTTCNAWCVVFYDGSKFNNNENKTLNLFNLINYLQDEIIIKQVTNFGFINSIESLHCLCLNCSLYKYLTSVVSNNILRAIKLTTDISLQTYEK